uniref:alpha-1,2-Mannosidase n=2 Tax=Panagrellus redivivus TaxID=6233 RepID=A0A7E4ZXP7_PANRE
MFYDANCRNRLTMKTVFPNLRILLYLCLHTKKSSLRSRNKKTTLCVFFTLRSSVVFLCTTLCVVFLIRIFLCVAAVSVLFLVVVHTNSLNNDAKVNRADSIVLGRDVLARNRILNPIVVPEEVKPVRVEIAPKPNDAIVLPPPERPAAPVAGNPNNNLDFEDDNTNAKKANGAEADADTIGGGNGAKDVDIYAKSVETVTSKDPEESNKGVVAGPDDTDAVKRDQIREMLRFSWQGYKNYSWGANELRPVSKGIHSQNIFGGSKMAATIVDGADSLYIMGLTKEYEEARDFIRDKFDIKLADGSLSVFETTIRFIGGLLTLYAMTGDEFYKTKAVGIADVLMPAFNTTTGIAKSLVDPVRGTASNYPWAQGGSSVLAEFGSLHLEFAYLSHITGDRKYLDKVKTIRDVLDKAEKPRGLYPNYINPSTGKFTAEHVSLGAMGDSFYEYLIKSYILTNKTDSQALKMHVGASEAIQANMLFTSKSGLKYLAELRNLNTPEHKMGHLACFVPGMFALESVNEANSTRKATLLQLAEDLANTCHESYIRTKTHIGPEMFYFNDYDDATSKRGENGYVLRPEVLEGFFYLWRLTGNQKYKDWIWDAVLAIEKYCKAPAGYSGIRDVNSDKPNQDDVQQSFFLAETLKYAYLAFDDEAWPLDKYVFNTEAHPFPIWQPDPVTGL